MEVVGIITYQIPGFEHTFRLKLSSAQPTFAEIRRLLHERNAPPDFYLIVRDPATNLWYHELDCEGGVIPLWEPLLLVAKAIEDRTGQDDEGQTRGKLCIKGPWGPIWV